MSPRRSTKSAKNDNFEEDDAEMNDFFEQENTSPPSSSSLAAPWRVGVIGAIVALVVIGGALVVWKQLQGRTWTTKTQESVFDQYQAIFLTNGKVYFGKVKDKNNQFVVFEDVYYLRQNEQLQSDDDGKKDQPQLSLVKLGDELHAPTDRMEINRDHILYIENLRADGRVVDAIRRYKAGQ